ncbi:acetyltransferase [Histoplasma capsulatum var. duboisii H88]|uniref:Acetyltransferase n=1 Tax=Ajellomyces capsulatus (strain H88) TaxID=544711 RepID=F0UA24_AJEC8|nr:acetyltransferase [Histoplasma capsulatum var. duboisii H88]
MAEPQLGPIVPNKPAIPPTRKPLHGRTITLEPLTAAHSDSLFSCLGGADNARLWDYMPDGPFTSKADFDNFIHYAATSEDRLFFSVMDRTGLKEAYSGKAVGFLSLLRIDVKNRAVEIGFVTFSRMLQRTTAATEAFYLMLAFVFDELHFRRCEWKCNDLNVPSKRAATRLGFLFEGVFRKHMIVKGRNRDSAWFSIVDEEWKGEVKGALEKWLDADNFDAEGRQKKDLVILIQKNQKLPHLRWSRFFASDLQFLAMEGAQSELARVVMERTSASREDVEAIGKLIREYGYATYGIPVCEEDLRAGDGTCRDRTRGTGSMVRRGNGQFLVGLDPDVPPTEQQQPLRRRAL